jgi:hypothetical protein
MDGTVSASFGLNARLGVQAARTVTYDPPSVFLRTAPNTRDGRGC